MNGNTNPYISATRGFLRSYQDYQKMRWQMENAEIDRQYKQSLMGVHRAQADWYRRRPTTTTSIKIFSPTQTTRIGEAAERAWDSAADTSHYKWWRPDRPKINAGEAYKNFKTEIGYDYLASEGQKEQADYRFKSLAGQIDADIDWSDLPSMQPPAAIPEAPEVGKRLFGIPGTATTWNVFPWQKGKYNVPAEEPSTPLEFKTKAPKPFLVPLGLEGVWDTMSNEEKEIAKEAIRQGISPQRIIERLNR